MWSQGAEQTVRRLIADCPPRDEWTRLQSNRLGALFAGWDLWSCWFLRPSGEVIIVGEDIDRPESEAVYSDHRHTLSALSGASRRHPELIEMFPPRESGAVDCRCVDHPEIFGPGNVICPDCGGVGWLPPEDTA